jgi:short subunit fatty acids transporter
MFIIEVENNAFPDLPKRKYKSIGLFYVTAIFVIPLVGTLFTSFNIALILMLIIFGLPMAIALIHMVTTEAGWWDFRVSSREKLSRAGEKIKSPVRRLRKRAGPKRRLKRNR